MRFLNGKRREKKFGLLWKTHDGSLVLLMHKAYACTVLTMSLTCMKSLYTPITSENLFLRSLSLANGSAPCWGKESWRDPPLKICL